MKKMLHNHLKNLLYSLLPFLIFCVVGHDQCQATAISLEDKPPFAIVEVLKGQVHFDGKEIKAKEQLLKPGRLTTGHKSFLKIYIQKWGNTITLGPDSEMMLDFEKEKKYTLDKGICFYKTLQPNQNSAKGKVFTSKASLGIRGTEFLLMENPLFNETEIVLFAGQVEMSNLSNPDNKQLILPGQWGGIGGRFGVNVSPPISLNGEQLKYFKEILANWDQ